MYKLYLDDIRNPSDTFKTTNNSEWVIVRSYKDFVQVVTQLGRPLIVSFDHDLAHEHYPVNGNFDAPIDYESHTEKTGFHAATWLVEYCLLHGHELPECHVHSANPVGRKNIQMLLQSWERTKEIYNK